MKVIGFMHLHYGKEYLRESLLSIRNHVDRMVIAYSYQPSHGFKTNLECPDKVDELFNICSEVLGSKLVWSEEKSYPNEHVHRAVIYKYSEGYDLILSIDADEIFEESEIETALKFAYTNKQRYYGIKGYLNFWRSFNHICLDNFRPIRIENLRNQNHEHNHECPLTIYHFSTAQHREIMEYKYKIFGHANEIRTNYLNEVFYSWNPNNNFGDLHPVARGIWNAINYDKNNLPDILKKHPNFNKQLI